MKSKRQLQLGESIKRVLSEIMQKEGLLSLYGGFVTIVEADISADAKNAKIFIDIIANEEIKKRIKAKIEASEIDLRYKLAKNITLKTVPTLRFIVDETSDNAERINNLINEIKNK